jgi:SAM-dependent methyltransferase
VLYRDDLSLIHHEGFSDFARRAGAALTEEMQRAGLPRGRVVDLGCGSGIWLQQLTQAGYEACGFDQSAAMLALAAKTAPDARLAEARAEQVVFPPCVAVTAMGEVLSYKGRGGRQRLDRIFSRAYRALCPGGLFVFDLMVTPKGPPVNYRTWRGGKSWAVMVEVVEDRRRHRVERNITTFRKAGRSYRRVQELHTLDVHTSDDIVQRLRKVGFRVRSSTHYGQLKLSTGRRVFWARKPRA